MKITFNFYFKNKEQIMVIIRFNYSPLKINKIKFDAFLNKTKESSRKKRRSAS